MTTGSVDSRFSAPEAQAPSWPDVETLLHDAELYWLTTVRPDGRPHTTPLVAVWHDHAFAFCTGVSEQKHHNLEAGSAVTVVTGVNTWKAGTDVVVEGTPERVTGRGALEPLAAAWVEKYGDDWPWEATDDGFTSGDGSEPWVYVVHPAKVIVFGKDPHSQVTFRP